MDQVAMWPRQPAVPEWTGPERREPGYQGRKGVPVRDDAGCIDRPMRAGISLILARMNRG